MTKTLKAHVLEPEAMDTSVRPQDDFYRYINGSWLKNHEIPADRPSDGSFLALRDQAEKDCYEIVKDAMGGKIDDADAKRIAILFSQFMDEQTTNKLGIAPLNPLLEQIWQAKDHLQLAQVGGRLAGLGISLFFGLGVDSDLNDAKRNIVYLEQAGLGLPDEAYYREEQYAEVREEYVKYLERLFSLLELDQFTPADCAAKVMQYETTLAAHHWDVVKSRDVEAQNNPRTWAQIIEDNPGFAWQEWFDALGLDPVTIPGIIAGQPDELSAGADLWQKTDLKVLQLWLTRKVTHWAAPFLSDPFVENNFDFYSKTLYGVEEMRPRWKRGLGLIEGSLGEALGRLYVERHFPEEYKERMDHLVANLLDAYRDSITNLDWMGTETKAKALEKLDSFDPKIGYPSKWRDYSEMEISDEKTLLDNVGAATAFNTQWELSRLYKPVDREEWHMTPQTVNAYYNPLKNEIVFPAAILQPPFFNPEADDAVNYAGIGAVIGHEIGHGFDDQGSQFDATGEVKNWWTQKDQEEFTKRTKELIAQYDKFSPAGLDDDHKVNGSLTIGENIGDLGGLTIAWKAWLKALKDQSIETAEDAPVIDGLSGPERFFASWARVWRSKARPEYEAQMLAVDPHSPPEFRCNGVLANFDEFAKLYDVLPEDEMWIDPQSRVTIW